MSAGQYMPTREHGNYGIGFCRLRWFRGPNAGSVYIPNAVPKATADLL